MATDYGTDLSSEGNDLEAFGRMVSGRTALAQALARRFDTERGTLQGDPLYGYRLANFLRGPFDARTRLALVAGAAAECEKDERVLAASCEASFEASTKTMRLAISAETSEGPFALVLNVSAVSVEILRVE
jgi:hypothetical protein